MGFKVGDRVRLKVGFVDYKSGAMGKVVGIWGTWAAVEFDEKSMFAHDCHGRAKLNYGLYVEPERLEKINENQIVIHQDGNKVIAKNLYTKEIAEAKCSHEDTFDFAVGASIALNRLLGIKEPSKAQKLNCRFVVVDKGAGISLTIGKIYEVENGIFEDDDGWRCPMLKELYTFEDLQAYLNTEYHRNANIKILEIKE